MISTKVNASQRGLDVLLAPALWQSADLTGHVALAVDVLRATSSLVTALENGAHGVLPVASVEEAKREAARIGRDALLCGERGSVRIPGFERSNSPQELEEGVYGRVVVLTTTNGTAALLKAREAEMCLGLALLNVEAVVRYLMGVERPIAVLLAGSSGRFNLEDALCAGAFIREFRRWNDYWPLTDAALHCLRLADQVGGDMESALRSSSHGQDLLAMGLEDDLVRCAALSTHDSVPVWDGSLLVRGRGYAVSRLQASQESQGSQAGKG